MFTRVQEECKIFTNRFTLWVIKIKINIDSSINCYAFEDNIDEFKHLNEPKGTSIFISFVSNDGIQDDLSTSQIDFCDIKKLQWK